ncbi:hypothetical protein BP5796_02879 [Coleophoma crateriformis]|uniref:Uncharacterized protein n=1 Tax=Coleophoma crateriformis TaxID=565419 RepID=A0A3D8SZJ2_9HELO|nr:hypothetical protein BP5796_02879 [Coleophoma crateriformis]
MNFYSRFLGTIAVLISVISSVHADCVSFGIDFQDGGSYFINSLDTSLFTSVVEFEGCSGSANVILEAPNEDSWLCSDIDASQDDVTELSTCPISKNQMYSGTWVLVLLSNNGDGSSFSSQRTFTLLVAPQQTVTDIPTVTITSDIVPTSTIVSTSTEQYYTTLPLVTISTVTTGKGTVTITPPVVTKTISVTSSQTKSIITYSTSLIYSTKTATCSVPTKNSVPDPAPETAALNLALQLVGSPTISSSAAVATASSKRKRDASVSRREVVRRKAIARHLEKRAPDVPTITVVDTNPADWVTSTILTTDPAVTTTSITTTSPTQTITPAPVTFYTGTVFKTTTLGTSSRTYTSIIRTTITTTKTSTQKYASSFSLAVMKHYIFLPLSP